MKCSSGNPVTIDGRRFLFFGTGACFSMAVFDRLIEKKLEPLAIVVPEYPPGRINKAIALEPSESSIVNPLIERSGELQIELLYAPFNRQQRFAKQINNFDFDFILLACWPYKLSVEVYSQASSATLNLHPSLLPKFRGINPVQRQMDSNDNDYGVSLHLLTQQFDCGDIVRQRSVPTDNADDSANIEKRAGLLGADLFYAAIDDFGSSAWQTRPQYQ